MRHPLPLVVFLTGAAVLIVEIIATRILSPYFGNTLYTVSSVITTILAALSVGYYLGGKLADKFPSLRLFYTIIATSGLLILLIKSFTAQLLTWTNISFGYQYGPLMASFFLFFFPSLILGTLSPLAIKLSSVQNPKAGIGQISGSIFFWSTLGSIFGSLSSGFLLIPRFGLDLILIGVGFGLVLLGSLGLFFSPGKKKFLIIPLVLSALVYPLSLTPVTAPKNVIYSQDGIYEKISVEDSTLNSRPVRYLHQDLSNSAAIYLDSDDHVFNYTKYFSLYKATNPQAERALVLGAGAYTIPKALITDSPGITVDVVDIEPGLEDISQKYFGLKPTDRINSFISDGRTFLTSSSNSYDLIYGDVYYSLMSIPSHFTTREFFTTVKSKLNPNGVFVGNFIGSLSRQQPSLTFSELKTFRSVFPNSLFFAVDSPLIPDIQNLIFVGFNSDQIPNLDHPDLTEFQPHLIDINRFELTPYPVLTDNYSPTDYLTAQSLSRYLNTKTAFKGSEALALISQQLRYGPRYPGSPGHKQTQNLITAELKTYTPQVQTQSWIQDGISYTNIIGRLFPERSSRIILATHYDSKKTANLDKQSPTNPMPGANDSASGVAVLLSLAQTLSTQSPPPATGIDLIFFDGEEGHPDLTTYPWQPIGSQYFSRNINSVYPHTKPQSGIVLDLICDQDLQIYQEENSLKSAPGLVSQVWSHGPKSVFISAPKYTVLDDHISLIEAGIPSILIIDFDYPFFHTTQDTLDKCSADSLQSVGDTLLKYINSL